jgi:hypothetical protein
MTGIEAGGINFNGRQRVMIDKKKVDSAFDDLTEWPSMTPRMVFYAGWEAHARASDARPVATVCVNLTCRGGTSEVSEPVFEMTPEFERLVDAEPSKIFSLYTARDAAPHSDVIDAARYRWLKENSDVVFAREVHWKLASGNEIYSAYPCEAELDQAVDAAIESQRSGDGS